MKNKLYFIFISCLIIFLSFTLALLVPFRASRERVGLGFSKGDRYFSKLQSWYSLAARNDWAKADLLEQQLDPADTVNYKSTHRPEELKKYINTITVKPNKTVEDWLELARVQTILGKYDDAYSSITTAKNLDPIRDDIGQIFYQTK